MSLCDCLIHPFQKDSGTSQRQRIIDALVIDAVQIDARTLADLLDYFVQLSRHINFYDKTLQISDWQPFFKNSQPFTLASIIRYPITDLENNFTVYNELFNRHPSSNGLQLNIYFIFYRFIAKINTWSLQFQNSGLPIATMQDGLIKNKLAEPLKNYIQYVNAAVRDYGIKRIDFMQLLANPVWNLDMTDLYTIDSSYLSGATSPETALILLEDKFIALFPVFPEVLKLIATEAELNINQSLLPLQTSLQKNHPPHLALLFTFINIFQQLQDDLNGYTQKHLDFFYREVLLFKPADDIPDRAHVVFEIQKQLDKYLIQKGIKLKDGKDNNKQDILFATNEDLVITQTTLDAEKSLFLNYKTSFNQQWVEGVYIAPAINMADGIDKSFQDGQPTSFSTLGAKYSKYIDPKSKLFKPFPHGRLGFIMASNVLYLKEGNRKIRIHVACQIKSSTPGFLPATDLFADVQNNIGKQYIVLNNDYFNQSLEKGFDSGILQQIRDKFMLILPLAVGCYSDKKTYRDEYFVDKTLWDPFITGITITDQKKILDEIFPGRNVLDIYFSGEKAWLLPSNLTISLGNLFGSTFMLTIEAQMIPGQPSIVAYNKDNLGEDLGSILPMVKITLNDAIKLEHKVTKNGGDQNGCCEQNDNCCLLNQEGEAIQQISYYHFFRDVEILDKISNNPNDATLIDVNVCGLKNFVVQNDESLMDVNGQVYPFGSRPKVNANFYIGSEEVLLKHWTNIFIHHSWKDLPADFKKYYVAYQSSLLGNPPNIIKDENFKMQLSILIDGKWIPWTHCKKVDNSLDCTKVDLKCQLFQKGKPTGLTCDDTSGLTHQYDIERDTDFLGVTLPEPSEKVEFLGVSRLDVDSRYGFLRISLQCQDFQHDIYPYILARQMLAFGKLPQLLGDAVYFTGIGDPIVFDPTLIKNEIIDSQIIALRVQNDVIGANGIAVNTGLAGNIVGGNADRVRKIVFPDPPIVGGENMIGDVIDLENKITDVKNIIDQTAIFEAIIPNEPYTPVMSGLAIDYRAVAPINDIQFVHLYPFEQTSKTEDLPFRPTVFPSFYDEGSLFLGLKALVPGDGLSVLFQLAEATSNSEADPETVNWHYLDHNQWLPLRQGFEISEDQTRNLTTSGIIRFSLPENISLSNTIMAGDTYWIKAAIPNNSTVVSETMSIYFHAVQATFTNDEANDKLRLALDLPAGSISRLDEADASVKTVMQPYDGFLGRLPEDQGAFYVRVSETLRHKGRAIQAFDYERIVLEAFPLVFKIKCINHSFVLNADRYINDFPMAPGYVILAVIPNLNKLKAGNSNEPKVPVSMLEDIEAMIRKCTSPFVRVRAVNPRYEKINLCMEVCLVKGKDAAYFREKLADDIRIFLEPWAIGQYDKLTFGQCVYRADIIRFIETRDYVDFINDIQIGKDGGTISNTITRLCPETPRSIFIAGNIEVKIDEPECEDWSDSEKCAIKPEVIINYCK